MFLGVVKVLSGMSLLLSVSSKFVINNKLAKLLVTF